jgi:hypothetical protein
MTLGINTQIADGSSFLPQIRYNVDAGRLFQIDRTQDAAGNWQTLPIELGAGFAAVFDFGSIETGWMLFAAGMAPSWQMVPFGQPLGERPTPEHKHGFRMHVWNPKIGLRELASASKTLVDAVDEIHTLFERAPEAQQGLLPVVKYTGATYIPPRGAASKPRFRPQFEITKWIPRGAEFGERTVPVPAPRMAASVASNWPAQQEQRPVSQGVTLAPQLGSQGMTASGASNPSASGASNPSASGASNPSVNASLRSARHVPPPVLPAGGVDEWGGPVAASTARTRLVPAGGDLDDEIPF